MNEFGVNKTKISKELKMHPNTVSKYLNSLQEMQIITKERVGKKDLYFLNEN